MSEYHPPPASLARLGSIVDALKRATKIDHNFQKGGKAVFKLESGELFYDSLLDLDTDGSSFAVQDSTGQSNTSLHQPNGEPVDSNAVPFFVLPGGGFEGQFDITLGDVAAVIFRDKVEFAVFADRGPRRKLGEGSIALHRSLGHEAIRGGKLHDEAIDADVLTIVFPGSGDGTPQTPQKIREIGSAHFIALGGSLP